MADPYLRDDARGRVHVEHAEREMRTAVRAAFRQYLTQVEAAVLDHRTSGNLTAAAGEPDPDLWPPVHIWKRLVGEHILPIVRRVLVRVFNRFLSKHQRARLDENDYIQQVLDDTRQRLTAADWPDEVYNAVRDVIRAGHEAGDNRRTLRRKIRQILGPDQWRSRADTIARTEATSALSHGTFQAGKARQDVFGETLYKRWSAIDDWRTRPAHAHADNQVVPYAEPFTVGGEPLQFPHDPSGSPGQTINCRCVLLVEDAEESRERSEAVNADATVAVKGKMPGTLKRYWTHGKGAAKIRWGTKNDFYRCRRHLRKYVPPHMINGLCSNLHKRALGVRPGQEGAKKADAGCCPAEDMTDEQIEEVLSAMRDDPALSGELDPDENTDEPTEDGDREEPAEADDEPEQPATSTDGITDGGVWDIPDETDVDDDDLDDGDGNTVTSAGDFTKSGAPNAGKRKRAEKNRHAMKGGRFPIENSNDLRKAIHAIGRAGGGPRGRAAVKAHIIRRAKALGLQSRLPEAWRAGKKTATAATSGNSWYETVAERVPNHPPAGWFTNPELSGPTKVRITDQGRVYGHLAAWDTEHASLPGVTARMFADDPLNRFHRHPIRTDAGERVRTGPLATGGHASTDEQVGLTAAQSHYDDPNFVAADVTVGKDEHGLWCSGALRPGASPFQVMLLDRYSISGDWRNGELVAACSVSVPGFHLDDDQNVYALAADAGPHRPTLGDHRPRAQLDEDGYLSSLVAAGVVTEQEPAGTAQLDGWQLFRQFQAAQRTHEHAEKAHQRVRAAAFGPLASRVRAATRQG